MRQTLSILVIVGLVSGCVPAPQPSIGLGTGIGLPAGSNSAYGLRPNRYQMAIKNYFSAKLKRGEQGQYKFAEPKRAYKQKGFAYGGELAWKGWLVETSVATPTRTGRYLTPKPYMVLFKGEQIVEHILGNSHKLLTKVD
jgi:hypothetical protein